MRFQVLTVTTLLLAGRVAAAADDLTIVSKVTQDGKPAGTSTSYIASDHVRMGREGHESIVDLKSGVMTVLDAKKKTYYLVTKEDLEKLKAKMQEQMNSPEMKQAQEAMKNMTPEQRKQMESVMGGMSTALEVQKTGTSRKIAGYGCEEWTITMGEISKSRECLTNELQYPVHAWETYKDFAESMKSVMSTLGPLAQGGAEMAEKFKKMKGIPLATTTVISIMGTKTTTEDEVTEVRRGPIPASAWEIPAGYTKVDNPMLKAFEGRGRGRPNR